MKKLTIVLITCTLAWSMPSCKPKEAHNKYDLDSFLPLNPNELFKKIEVVVLDSIPDQPIRLIVKMDYLDSLFYIQDWQRTSILVYSESGKFVRSIGSKGRGPGELEDIRDFQINRFTGNIEIMGNPSPSIMIYDTEGNFIGKRNIGNRVLTIDKFHHITPDLTAWLALGEDYKISVYSEKLNKIVHEYSLGMDKTFMGLFHYMMPFSQHGDTTFFFDTYANTINKFDGEKMKFEVYKKLDFGKYNFSKSKLPAPKVWETMNHEQRIDFTNKISKEPLQCDKFIGTDEYSFLTRWDYYIFTQKNNNSTIQYHSLIDSTRFFIDGMNSKFAFSQTPLLCYDKNLNESMVEKNVLQKLEKLRRNDNNQEMYAIVKYWFK